MNEVAMTIVFIEPRRIRNCSRVCFLVIWDPMIAAWELPRPGRREQIGETRIVAMVGLMMSFLLKGIFSVVCSGRIVFDLIECVIVEVAKSPVRSGRSGFWIGRFRVAVPRNAARVKIIIAFVFDSFSVEIRKITTQIRRMPIIRWMIA